MREDGYTKNKESQPEKEKSQDEIFAGRFWERQRDTGRSKELIGKFRDRLKEQIKEMIQNSPVEEGKQFIKIFVTREGITEEDKEKLSAYRLLAKEFGYEIGAFNLNRKTGVATAEIKVSQVW